MRTIGRVSAAEASLNVIALPGALWAAEADGDDENALPEAIGGTAMLWDTPVEWWAGFTRELAAGCITAENLAEWAAEAERDVVLLRQHSPGEPLARQASADRRLDITVTDTGLDWTAPIAADSPISAAVGADVRDRVLTACSFMGRVLRSEWIEDDDAGTRHQRITAIRLMELTVCIWPRWPQTSAVTAAGAAPIIGEPGLGDPPQGAPPDPAAALPIIAGTPPGAPQPPDPSPEDRDSPPRMTIAAALASTIDS